MGSSNFDNSGSGMGMNPGDTYNTENTDNFNNQPGVGGNQWSDNQGAQRTKPSMGDKLKGDAEILKGKLTRNPEEVQLGRERKVRPISYRRYKQQLLRGSS
jgi:hypothetical protein